MKKTIVILLLFCLAVNIQAQKNAFSKNYLKLRASTENNFVSKTLKGKELQLYIDSLQMVEENLNLLKEADQVTIIMDMDEAGQPSASQIEQLLDSYEQLTSMETKGMMVDIRGTMKKDKVKDFIIMVSHEENDMGILNMMFGKSLFFIDISFKKPIELTDYIANLSNVDQWISINSDDEDSNSFIKVDFETEGTWELLPSVREFEVVKENGLYGVKSVPSSEDKEAYMLINPKYKNEIQLFKSNSFNSDPYFKMLKDDNTSSFLYDQHNFSIVGDAQEITPVYAPNSELVSYFIIVKNNLYSLYECPWEYRQTQKDGSIGAHINYRIENCKSIKVKDVNTLECVKADGEIELVEIKEVKSERD